MKIIYQEKYTMDNQTYKTDEVILETETARIEYQNIDNRL